jgi:hypothetical protein
VFDTPEPANEVVWATGRMPDRTYLHRSFYLNLPASQDYGQPARYVVKVFDELLVQDLPSGDEYETEVHVLMTTPGGRKQMTIQLVRESGNVRQIQIQQVPTEPTGKKLKTLLTLDRQGSQRLIDVIKSLDSIPIEGGASVRIDDDLLRQVFEDPDVLQTLYDSNPEAVRNLIEVDTGAEDVIAIARRREVCAYFRNLLLDDDFFDSEAANHGGQEAVWQHLFEEEPWLLGSNLTGQVATGWSDERLEQVVKGYSVDGPGKRADALMRTNGRIRAMVFTEIKHHRTPLVDLEYRSGCWAPSEELTGGVVQVQQTVHLATREIHGRLAEIDRTGAETGEHTYLVRPRSFLIVGTLDQLRGDSGVNKAKYESFELFRRNLYEPEILTFDELLARAEWQCSMLET